MIFYYCDTNTNTTATTTTHTQVMVNGSWEWTSSKAEWKMWVVVKTALKKLVDEFNLTMVCIIILIQQLYS